MKFENDISAPPSTSAMIRDHLPLLLVGGGLIAAFISLHTAAWSVLAIAIAHLLVGLVAVVTQQIRKSRRSTVEVEAS